MWEHLTKKKKKKAPDVGEALGPSQSGMKSPPGRNAALGYYIGLIATAFSTGGTAVKCYCRFNSDWTGSVVVAAAAVVAVATISSVRGKSVR